MKILARIGATLGGLLAGGLAVMAIEGVSSAIYKMPAELDVKNVEAMADWIRKLPLGAYLFVLTAWACGCFIGAYVARRLTPERFALPGVIVWTFFTIASIANLIMIPHPLWFAMTGVSACLVFGLLGLLWAAPRSYTVRCTRTIHATLEKVFQTLATTDEFCKAVPAITKIEFLTPSHYGVGTRFRETRRMHGKEAATELEVTELVENQRVRMVSDTGGTIWDTTFVVTPVGEHVRLQMHMEARPHQFLARMMTPLIVGVVGKFVMQDMDAVKRHCEQGYVPGSVEMVR